eukprot:COSAG02_NODE_38136_length_433_cov_0.523952_1_plen_40_part_01
MIAKQIGILYARITHTRSHAGCWVRINDNETNLSINLKGK